MASYYFIVRPDTSAYNYDFKVYIGHDAQSLLLLMVTGHRPIVGSPFPPGQIFPCLCRRQLQSVTSQCGQQPTLWKILPVHLQNCFLRTNVTATARFELKPIHDNIIVILSISSLMVRFSWGIIRYCLPDSFYIPFPRR